VARRVVLFLAHSIEEFDQVSLLHRLGYEVASIGGYIRPCAPHDDKRPALPEVPTYEEVASAVEEAQAPGGTGCAQTHIPDRVLEWLGDDGVMIWHHLLDQRLFPQWERLSDWRRGGSDRRIVWRTVGQSVENNERNAQRYREDGLEVVRYSPKERNIPGYCGEDALIRFYKDPDVWGPWTGERQIVTHVSQDLVRRHPWTNAQFFFEATVGLPFEVVGPGSEGVRGGLGVGPVSYDDMRERLRTARAYLYTGTQPASYTLGLVEALVTGIPVVSIGPSHMQIFPYGHDLFEGHELAPRAFDDPDDAWHELRTLLASGYYCGAVSAAQRDDAVGVFGVEAVGKAWKSFLG
jgi:hypothetical protein